MARLFGGFVSIIFRMSKNPPPTIIPSGAAKLRPLDNVYVGVLIFAVMGVISAYFKFSHIGILIDFLFISALGFCAFAIAKIKSFAKRDIFAITIISILAICFGAKNNGLFGLGAGAIFWPSIAGFFLKPRPLISVSASILVFAAILFFGLAGGNIPDLENPIFPSLLSLGVNAIILSILNNFGMGIFGNISKKQEKEIQIAQNRAEIADNKSKERAVFIAQMSHEIRNPLNAIIGFGDLLRAEPYGPLQPQYREFAELILQGGHHLNDLVGDILDMSKIEAGRYTLKTEVFDICELGRDTIALCQSNAATKSIEIDYIGAKNLEINADKRAMRQIMLNLISNSIKYSDENAKIIMRIFGNKSHFWLEIEDTGRGMSEDEIAIIGEPYMEAKSNDGKTRTTGLGLSLVKKLTQMQNGDFNVTSQIGEGTLFSLRFPI